MSFVAKKRKKRAKLVVYDPQQSHTCANSQANSDAMWDRRWEWIFADSLTQLCLRQQRGGERV